MAKWFRMYENIASNYKQYSSSTSSNNISSPDSQDGRTSATAAAAAEALSSSSTAYSWDLLEFVSACSRLLFVYGVSLVYTGS